MTSDKSPSYQWYPRDFEADEHVKLMDLEAEGAYRRLLDHQWLHGSIPVDVIAQAAICKRVAVGRMRRLWAQMRACFVAVDDDPTRLVNRRLERIRAERELYLEGQRQRGRDGAERRWAELRDSKRYGDGDSVGHTPATDLPMANHSLPSASSSASASADNYNNPPSVPGDARTKLIGRLKTEPGRHDVVEFLEAIPGNQSETTWVRILLACLDGMGMPGGKAATTRALVDACRDFPALAGTSERWSPRHFRACVVRAMAGDRPTRDGTRTGPVQGTAKITAAMDEFVAAGPRVSA